MAAEHYIYKYVFHDEIIYIGKVNSDLKRRVEEHAREEKFFPYLKEASVFCIQLANPTETTFMELYLINKYKPVLNIVAKYEGMTNIQVPEPAWIPYEQYLKQKEDLSAGYKTPTTLVLNAELCPNPVPLGFLSDSKEVVSILSFSGTLANRIFCTFRSMPEQTVVYLEKHLFYLEQKETLIKKEIP